MTMVVGGLLLSQFVIVFANMTAALRLTVTSPCWLLLPLLLA
ncbi:hypothetical protein O9992_01770 [Vibrio lentus]|nr:hypothetical protein [Vibrio lentus]